MKWIKEPIPNCSAYTENMLALSEREAIELSTHLQGRLKELRRRFERLEDIHWSGEATTRQETTRVDTEDAIGLIEMFINQANLLVRKQEKN